MLHLGCGLASLSDKSFQPAKYLFWQQCRKSRFTHLFPDFYINSTAGRYAEETCQTNPTVTSTPIICRSTRAQDRKLLKLSDQSKPQINSTVYFLTQLISTPRLQRQHPYPDSGPSCFLGDRFKPSVTMTCILIRLRATSAARDVM